MDYTFGTELSKAVPPPLAGEKDYHYVFLMLIGIVFLTLERGLTLLPYPSVFFKQNAAEEGAAAGDKRRRIGSDQNHDNARPVQSLHRVAQHVSDVASGGADAAACNIDRIEVDIRAENDADDTILVNDYNVNDGE